MARSLVVHVLSGPRHVPGPNEEHARFARNIYFDVCSDTGDSRSNIFKLTFACHHHGSALAYVNEELKNNMALVIQVVSQDGDNLRYCSPSMKGNPWEVRKAVDNAGEALQYASDAIRDDTDIVFAAVCNDGAALQYASERIRNDAGFVVAAVKSQPVEVMQFLRGTTWANNCFIAKLAVTTNAYTFRFVGEIPQDNWWICLQAIKVNGWHLRFASARLQGDTYLQQVAQETINECNVPAGVFQ